jgi:formamidopyrimidine-DNA glycosylase
MPELPEVETVRRGLQQTCCHQTITGVEVLRESTIAHPASIEDFQAGLVGNNLQDWQRRGKYLLALVQNQRRGPRGWLGVHLRMTGQLLWLSPAQDPSKHTRLRLFMGDRELRFVDQRTFGKVWWIAPTEAPEKIMAGMGQLGPEPLTDSFVSADFVHLLQQSRRSVKAVLLDQRVVAGIGNIYADEALFLGGIHPTTPGANLSADQAQALHQKIRHVLQSSIDAGGTTFSNYLNVQGVNGNYGGQAWVYGRAGLPCRQCGTAIVKIKAAGRGTHYCPQCQPEADF